MPAREVLFISNLKNELVPEILCEEDPLNLTVFVFALKDPLLFQLPVIDNLNGLAPLKIRLELELIVRFPNTELVLVIVAVLKFVVLSIVTLGIEPSRLKLLPAGVAAVPIFKVPPEILTVLAKFR
jgi:hypothetical protein